MMSTITDFIEQYVRKINGSFVDDAPRHIEEFKWHNVYKFGSASNWLMFMKSGGFWESCMKDSL
jgi:hypothetical protein